MRFVEMCGKGQPMSTLAMLYIHWKRRNMLDHENNIQIESLILI